MDSSKSIPTFIIVANGFRVRGHYYIKELTNIHLHSDLNSFHVTVKLPEIQVWRPIDHRQVNYCTSHIHRLAWENRSSCLPIEQVLNLIQTSIQIEELCSSKKVIIGIKGDRDLKILLEKLSCTVVDIEKDFHCPKVKQLTPSPLFNQKVCIFHQDIINHCNCSVYKARCYQKFLLNQSYLSSNNTNSHFLNKNSDSEICSEADSDSDDDDL